MIAAIHDDNPVVVVDNKQSLGVTADVPTDMFEIPIGQAHVVRSGSDATVVATGRMVAEAVSAAEALAGEGVSLEVIDPRSLQPLDIDTILASVARTHRCLVAHEAVRFGGIGAEIAAQVQELAFDELDGPVHRVGAPFSPFRSARSSNASTCPTPAGSPPRCGACSPSMAEEAGPVGLIVNPEAGRDVRRMLSPVTLVSRTAKMQMVQRVVHGAVGAGATEIVYMADPHGLVEAALADLHGDWTAHPAGGPVSGRWSDTIAAAGAMRDKGCAVVVTLGGDGTNRAAALGWPNLPVVAVSTGTNNAFPRLVDPTAAGAAAGLVSSGAVSLAEVADRVAVLDVIGAGRADRALVDVILVDARFVGAGAVWDPGSLIASVVGRADPTAMGMAGLAGLATGATAPWCAGSAGRTPAAGPAGGRALRDRAGHRGEDARSGRAAPLAGSGRGCARRGAHVDAGSRQGGRGGRQSGGSVAGRRGPGPGPRVGPGGVLVRWPLSS